jgi:hypothetical protein
LSESLNPKIQKAGRQKQVLNPHTQRGSEEATEDYLETINSLIKEKGFAASADVAERMKGFKTKQLRAS